MKQEQVRTVYMLESADAERRIGVLKIKAELPKNAKWRTIDVSLSGLLAHRIANNRFDGLSRPQTFVGTKFVSTVNSPEFSENPFKLTKFVPKGNSDIPENFLLSLVIERYSPKEEIIDALGNKCSMIRNFKRTIPKYFLRYVESETTAMLSSLKSVIVINK